MIYALTGEDLTPEQRTEIAEAIKQGNRRVIDSFARIGQLAHIAEIRPDRTYFCIYCRGKLRPTLGHGLKSHVAQLDWHFQHARNSQLKRKCMGATLHQETGIKNPSNHGCYVRLEAEHFDGYTRQDCNCREYCHLAVKEECV